MEYNSQTCLRDETLPKRIQRAALLCSLPQHEDKLRVQLPAAFRSGKTFDCRSSDWTVTEWCTPNSLSIREFSIVFYEQSVISSQWVALWKALDPLCWRSALMITWVGQHLDIGILGVWSVFIVGFAQMFVFNKRNSLQGNFNNLQWFFLSKAKTRY